MKYRVGADIRNLQSCRHMTGFKMDASFRFSSEDVVKPVCEISPLGTFERRCLTPRCSRNLRQAKYTEGEQGRSRLSLYNKPEWTDRHRNDLASQLGLFANILNCFRVFYYCRLIRAPFRLFICWANLSRALIGKKRRIVEVS